MATPLRLPAHADIHEFGVMYTKSVKKKAKDWHDGYLKWHTFNYRAILYDDQRKPVANEFFPNKNISSNSELEFSSAIVQIGDQLETIQANLEHIYRTTAQKSGPEVDRQPDSRTLTVVQTPTTKSRTMTMTSSTPRVSRLEQKRIYPVPASRVRRTIVMPSTAPETSKKPLEEGLHTNPRIRTKLITPQVARQVHYPTPGARSGADSAGPGWFARQDQVILPKDDSETDPPVPDAILATRRKAKRPETPTEKGSLNERPRLKRKRQSEKRTMSHDVPDQVPEVVVEIENTSAPLESVLESTTNRAVLNTNEEHDTVSESRKESKLDPTRTTNKPKRRELLAAKRHRTGSAEVLRGQSETSGTVSGLQRKQCEVSERVPEALAVGHVVHANDIAIYDIDTSRWVPEQTTKNENLITTCSRLALDENSQTHTQIGSENLGIATVVSSGMGSLSSDKKAKQQAQITLSEPGPIQKETPSNAIDRTAATRQDERRLRDVDQRSFMSNAPAYDHQSDGNARGLIQDDDTFVPCGAGRIQPKKIGACAEVSHLSSTTKLQLKSEKLSNLIEQFPQSPAMRPNNSSFSPTKIVSQQTPPESPLFLPDFGASQEVNQGTQPGLFTQMASKAAQDIARHSSINKLVPNRAKQKKPFRKGPTMRQIPTNALRAGNARSEEGSTTLAKTSNSAQSNQELTSTTHHSLPPTPVEIATAEIDSIFDDESSNRVKDTLKTGVVLQDVLAKRVSRVLRESKQYFNTKSNDTVMTTEHLNNDYDAEPNYKIATQINSRAPDFMSAKSYQGGAKLQLDKPIAAVGMSAREIAALDLLTQLSCETAQQVVRDQEFSSQ
ncbi:protein of unknown function [Taphrina deformans PYCC 5710]|uniref:5'-3' DNA helicase ZGRF1-like N-terminal domain-containing protein n=1 Tax=Taphrina deformans (strain PYCC 5710 / ATCC 11124 / CBS 356.35 / IMI 108563 / JCM 9778 / NBRC 8474) TaxID=1097556 RepID=R4XK57_TAPDE|nr:protein of unknown function [Taphrina deformans PYCC 5710]|eukprot:CCG84834.1 protein of unknown function [Taphrina deformans PYCC 5710]